MKASRRVSQQAVSQAHPALIALGLMSCSCGAGSRWCGLVRRSCGSVRVAVHPSPESAARKGSCRSGESARLLDTCPPAEEIQHAPYRELPYASKTTDGTSPPPGNGTTRSFHLDDITSLSRFFPAVTRGGRRGASSRAESRQAPYGAPNDRDDAQSDYELPRYTADPLDLGLDFGRVRANPTQTMTSMTSNVSTTSSIWRRSSKKIFPWLASLYRSEPAPAVPVAGPSSSGKHIPEDVELGEGDSKRSSIYKPALPDDAHLAGYSSARRESSLMPTGTAIMMTPVTAQRPSVAVPPAAGPLSPAEVLGIQGEIRNAVIRDEVDVLDQAADEDASAYLRRQSGPTSPSRSSLPARAALRPVSCVAAPIETSLQRTPSQRSTDSREQRNSIADVEHSAIICSVATKQAFGRAEKARTLLLAPSPVSSPVKPA